MSGLIINPYAFAPSGGGGCSGGDPTQLLLSTPAGTQMAGASNTSQNGWVFTLSQAVEVTGGRALIKSDRDVTVRVWRASDEALLGSVEFTCTRNVWGSASFASAFCLEASTTYVVTVRNDDGSTTSYPFTNKTNVTFESFVTHLGPVLSAGTGYPGVGAGGDNVSGLVDLVVNA